MKKSRTSWLVRVARHKFFLLKNKRFGFTLIELLIVIAILGIIGTFVAFRLINSTSKARDGIRKSNLAQIASALEQYYTDNGFHYIAGNYTSQTGDNWIPGLNPYFRTIPKDPRQAGIINTLASNFRGIGKNGVGQVAAIQTMILRPNADGNRTGVQCVYAVACTGTWATQYPASGAHWDKVAEATPDEDSTYIESTVDGQWDGYAHPASGIPVGSAISNVKICVRAKYLAPGSANNVVAPAVISKNWLYWSDFTITTSYANYCQGWAMNPNGGSWTVADVDAAQITVRKSYSGTDVRVTQMWMEVTYDPSTAPTPTPTPTAAPTPTPTPAGGGSVSYYGYYSDAAGSYYELWAVLEDASDPQTNTSPNAKCALPVPSGAPIPFNYCMASHK